MLKVRVMGTKKDIKWFANNLRESDQISIVEFSEIYQNKGTNNYFRAYLEVESSKEKEK